MSMSHTVDRPDPPRPVIGWLPLAAKAAVEAGTELSEMNLSRWAQSFQTSEEAVREAFDKALWEHTQKPSDEYGDGK